MKDFVDAVHHKRRFMLYTTNRALKFLIHSLALRMNLLSLSFVENQQQQLEHRVVIGDEKKGITTMCKWCRKDGVNDGKKGRCFLCGSYVYLMNNAIVVSPTCHDFYAFVSSKSPDSSNLDTKSRLYQVLACSRNKKNKKKKTDPTFFDNNKPVVSNIFQDFPRIFQDFRRILLGSGPQHLFWHSAPVDLICIVETYANVLFDICVRETCHYCA